MLAKIGKLLHSMLSGLDYDSSGHTGFQPAGSYLETETDPLSLHLSGDNTTGLTIDLETSGKITGEMAKVQTSAPTEQVGNLWLDTDEHPPNTAHSTQTGLDYASAGHTGFEPAITAGTSAQFIKGDKSLDSTSYQPVMPYIKYSNTQSNNVGGGTATSGSWLILPLNTEDFDTAGIGSIASNKVTLPAGTYQVRASSPFCYCNRGRIKLYNSTDSSDIILGTCAYAAAGTDTGYDTSTVCGQFTIAAQKDISLYYRVQTTMATSGLGLPMNWGESEVYAQLELWKIA